MDKPRRRHHHVPSGSPSNWVLVALWAGALLLAHLVHRGG